ncbi:MAG: dephospho-CoA kinase [SAR324 cluster bacterium]|nr:dephospho-CoA kinase [SAR324 cluster bacterium]
MPAPILIGLTGGIASGKSTVARWVAEAGIPTLNADELGHRLLRSGHPGCDEVISCFGSGILDEQGEIDRKRLGVLVFADPEALKRLNAIAHPWIGRIAQQEAQAAAEQREDRLVLLEAALLLEADWSSFCTEVWVVQASAATVMDRLTRQRGLSVEDARQRLDSQWTPEQRKPFADVLIENEGTLDEMKPQVEQELQLLQNRHQPNRA